MCVATTEKAIFVGKNFFVITVRTVIDDGFFCCCVVIAALC